jgi:hypothetical protein
MKNYRILGVFLVFITTNVIVYGQDFQNLQWRDAESEITDACIGDNVLISFETNNNIIDGKMIEIEVWESTNNKLMDLIKKLTGVVNNGKVELGWTVEFDEQNTETNYYNEIEENGFTILDYVFVINYQSKRYISNLLGITAWGNRQMVDERTGEPIRNMDYILMLLTPDRKDREYINGTTDDDGRIKLRNIRKIGDWRIIM